MNGMRLEVINCIEILLNIVFGAVQSFQSNVPMPGDVRVRSQSFIREVTDFGRIIDVPSGGGQ